MKNLFLILLPLFFFSCRKEAAKPVHPYTASAGRPQPYTGTVTATRNGVAWKGYVYACKRATFTNDSSNMWIIRFDHYSTMAGDTFRNEELSVDGLKLKAYRPALQTFMHPDYSTNLAPDSVEKVFGRIDEYDLGLDQLILIENRPNIFNIDRFDPVTLEFSGSFAFDFLSSRPGNDTIRFRDGQFNGRIYPSFFPWDK